MTEAKKHHLTFGESKVAYNPENLLETMTDFESGADNDLLKALAKHFSLPIEPFNKKLVKPVLIGEVQNEWYRVVKGSVPTQPTAYQKSRIENYKVRHEQFKNSDGTDLLTSRSSSKGEKKERKANVYRLTAETKEKGWGTFKGQKRLIIKAMQELDAFPAGKGCTVKQIADTVKDTEETVKPSDKNCAFHINAFGHEGIVEMQKEDGTWGAAHDDPKPKTPPPSDPKKDDAKKATPEAGKKDQGKGKKK